MVAVMFGIIVCFLSFLCHLNIVTCFCMVLFPYLQEFGHDVFNSLHCLCIWYKIIIYWVTSSFQLIINGFARVVVIQQKERAETGWILHFNSIGIQCNINTLIPFFGYGGDLLKRMNQGLIRLLIQSITLGMECTANNIMVLHLGPITFKRIIILWYHINNNKLYIV